MTYGKNKIVQNFIACVAIMPMAGQKSGRRIQSSSWIKLQSTVQAAL
jgi:hypothetical protein